MKKTALGTLLRKEFADWVSQGNVCRNYGSSGSTRMLDMPRRGRRHRVQGLGSVWRDALTGYDRERAFRALEVATFFALRRAVRNGSVGIEHSLAFRGRERLFLPTPSEAKV